MPKKVAKKATKTVSRKAAKKSPPAVAKKSPAKAAAKKKPKKASAKAKKPGKPPLKKASFGDGPPIGTCIWTKTGPSMLGAWSVNISSVVFSPGANASVYTEMMYPKAFPVKLATNNSPEVVGDEITLVAEPGTGNLVFESVGSTEIPFEPDVMRIVVRFLTNEIADDKPPT